MPQSEYTSIGGRLRIKGVRDAGINKKKKKKKKTTLKASDDSSTAAASPSISSIKDIIGTTTSRDGHPPDKGSDNEADRAPVEEDAVMARRGKTEAELRFEEARRKRLHEKLQKEGVKTHKERVEEYNKYLSKLSEHHDMPKIGPG